MLTLLPFKHHFFNDYFHIYTTPLLQIKLNK